MGTIMAKKIIGLTGSFGSGCSHIAETHLQHKGFNYISLSQILKDEYFGEKEQIDVPRKILQDFGNQLREKHGPDYLAQIALSYIQAQPEDFWVVDSIKNPYEVKCFREVSSFFLIGVFADYHIRWSRKKTIYKGNEAEFFEDDKRDSNEEISYGQRVRDSFAISDLVILNNRNYNPGSNPYNDMEVKIKDFLNLIDHPSFRQPSEEEALMAIAYANSLRSSCLKRKVGAVIVDNRGVILSSGYNEVPIGEDPCKGLHGDCYRNLKKQEIKSAIDGIVFDKKINLAVNDVVLKQQKMLELCRSLHAEENAIINIARFGSQVDLREATLYTTTYPCNLCANKISQVGIGKVVYLEPYPQEEAKTLLDARRIEQKPFEGVSYKGYFRLFGSENL